VVYDISRTLSAIIYLKKCHIGMELHPKPMWSIDCMQGKTISGGFGLLGIVYVAPGSYPVRPFYLILCSASARFQPAVCI
jgi:hypothetical protein